MADTIDDMLCKLSVGDEVLTNADGSKAMPSILRGVIGEVTENCVYIWHNEPSFAGTMGRVHPKHAGYKYAWKIKRSNSVAVIVPAGEETTNTPSYSEIEKPTMNSVSTFFRNLGRSETDKILLSEGLEDPTGVPTRQGLDLMLEILYRDYREEKLVPVVQDMVAARKAEEKRSK